MPGNGKLQLTGQLGDVMKESAQAAFSLIKSRADFLGIEAEVFRKQDLHVHIPAEPFPRTDRARVLPCSSHLFRCCSSARQQRTLR